MNERAKNFLVGMAKGEVCVPEYEKVRRSWAKTKVGFSIPEASSFFIGHMLNRQTKGKGRPFRAGELFIAEYYPNDDAWERIAGTSLKKLNGIIRRGFDIERNTTTFKGSFCGRIPNFPRHLKDNARIMLKKFGWRSEEYLV